MYTYLETPRIKFLEGKFVEHWQVGLRTTKQICDLKFDIGIPVLQYQLQVSQEHLTITCVLNFSLQTASPRVQCIKNTQVPQL